MSAGAGAVPLSSWAALARRLRVPLGVALVAGLLALLWVAETTWLHEGIPQQFEARESAVFVPAPAAPGDGDEWRAALVAQATSDSVLDAVARALTLRDPDTGEAFTATALRAHLAVTAQCVRPTNDPQGPRAARLALTVQGLPREQARTVARQWLAAIRSQLAALAVDDPARFMTAYSPCPEQ